MDISIIYHLFKRPIVLIIVAVSLLLLIFVTTLLVITSSSSKNQTQTGNITLTVWALEDQSLYNEAINGFLQSHPQVKVVYKKQSLAHFRERITNKPEGGQAGSTPDVIVFHNTWTPMLQQILVPLPTDIVTAKDYGLIYYPDAIKSLVNPGTKEIVGIPISADGLALYINNDLYAQKNLSPPKDWESFSQNVELLTTRDDTGVTVSGAAIGTAQNVPYFSDIIGAMIVQQGDTLSQFSDKNSDIPGILDYYTSFATGQGKVWSATLGNPIDLFAKGKVAMLFGPAQLAPQIKAKNPQLHFRAVPIPQLRQTDQKAWASYWAWGVSKYSPNGHLAWELAWTLSSKTALIRANLRRVALNGYGLPYPRKDLASREVNDPILSAFVSQAPFASSLQLADQTQDNGANDEIIQALKTAITNIDNGASSQQELSAVVGKINDAETKFNQ